MQIRSKYTHPYRALLVICTAAFLVPFTGSSINLALPQIATAFSMKAVSLTWIATAYLISTAVFQIPFARLADMVGRRKVFTLGIAIFTLCTFLCGWAPSGAALIVLRALSGVGSAMVFGTSIAILTSVFPPEQRGKALGINTAVVYAALAAGPFLGGMLTHYLGWQSLFFVTAGAGVLVFVFARFFLHEEWKEAHGEKFDLIGSALYGAGVASLFYGFSSLPHVRGFVCLAASILLLIAFVHYELKSESPIMNMRLLSGNRVFSFSILATLINYAATSAIAFMLSLYLQYVRDLDASHAGLILISQACVQSVFSLVSGPLSDRVSPSRLATVGMLIIVCGLTGLIFLGQYTPQGYLIALLVLLGMGFGIFSSPNTNVVMGSIDKKYYSQASATLGTMRLTGQAFSMGIAGMAISFHVGNRTIIPELHGAFMESMRTTFIIFLALCLLGVYASSVRQRATKRA